MRSHQDLLFLPSTEFGQNCPFLSYCAFEGNTKKSLLMLDLIACCFY